MPGCFDYQKFSQIVESSDVVNARAVRELWDQACDGGDVDSAVKVCHVSLLPILPSCNTSTIYMTDYESIDPNRLRGIH